MFQQSEFVAHSSIVTCLSIGALSQNILATGGEDCVVHVWNSDAKNIWKLNGNKTPIECVCFNPNEEYVASGARSGSIKIFDISEGKVARNLRGHQTTTNCLFYHPHADILLSGSLDTQVKAWDLRNKECLMTCPGHEKSITCVRFSPDGRWLVTAGQDGKIIFWDVVAGKVIHTIKCSAGSYALQLEFSPVELYLAVSTSARVCVVYDCENNFESICTTPAESSPVRRICFSDQGRTLHIASDGNLRVYELPNNQYYRGITDGGCAAFGCVYSSKVAWDKVADMRLNEHNVMLAGSFNANFVTLHSAELSAVCDENGGGDTGDGNVAVADDDEYGSGDFESKVDTPDHTPDRTPDRRQKVDQHRELPSSQKKVFDLQHQSRLTTASDSKITSDEQDEEDFIYGNSRTPRENPTQAPFQVPSRGRGQSMEAKGARYGGGDVKEDPGGERITRSASISAGADDNDDNDYNDYNDVVRRGKQLYISPLKKPATAGGSAFAAAVKGTPPAILAARERAAHSSHGKATPSSASKRTGSSSRMSTADAKGGNEQRALNFEEMAIIGNKHRNPVLNDNRPSAELVADTGAKIVPSLNLNPSGGGGGRDIRSRGGGHYQRRGMEVNGTDVGGINESIGAIGTPADITTAASSASSASSTIPLLNKLLDNYIEDGKDFSSKLSHRMSSLRILQGYWNSGNISQVMSEIQLMYESNRALTLTCRNSLQGNMLKHAQQQQSQASNYVLDEGSHQLLVHESKQPIMIIADFLSAVDGLRGLINIGPNSVTEGLTLDMSVKLLPILDNMLNDSSLEHVLRASVITTIVIVEAFGDVIASTRSNISIGNGRGDGVGGVDLSREERVNKCNQCYAELNKIYSRICSLRRSSNSSSSSGSGSSSHQQKHSSAGANKKYGAGTIHELARLESRLSDIIVS